MCPAPHPEYSAAMSSSLPQHGLDGGDPYQVYIHLMLGVSCDSCAEVLPITPAFGEGNEYSWDWYRITADHARRAGWWISPFTPEGLHPMRCLCSACHNKIQPISIESDVPANP